MDAKCILHESHIPHEMSVDCVDSLSSERSRTMCCTGVLNELWKLVAVLHVLERTERDAECVEFQTPDDALLRVVEDLQALHEFLTGRLITIRIQLVSGRSLQQRFSHPSMPRPLVLFSGGLDSLAAALSLSTRTRPLLFHATTSNIIMSRALSLRCGHKALIGHPMMLGDCRFSGLGGGFSQTRGLLFLSAAANAAWNLGASEIVVGENAPLMINPAVSPSSTPTRNAHPRLICDFERIVRQLTAYDFQINPLNKDMTKTEVVLPIVGECGRSLQESYSCWRTQGLAAMCGLCFACFVRRMSLLAVEIQEPPSLYGRDPFCADFSDLALADQGAINDLKDSLTYYKRFITESEVPSEWVHEIPAGFFEDAKDMLRRFALDLFVGARSYFRLHPDKTRNVLARYCLTVVDEIGAARLDARKSELRKRTVVHKSSDMLE